MFSSFVSAAKVTVASKAVGSCNTTYGVTVIDSYLPCPNSTIPQLPLVEAQIITYTQPCSSCIDLTVGQTYWVGGTYYVNCRGQPVWEIPRIKGAAALWTTKYDQKGPTWVQTARREHGCWPIEHRPFFAAMNVCNCRVQTFWNVFFFCTTSEASTSLALTIVGPILRTLKGEYMFKDVIVSMYNMHHVTAMWKTKNKKKQPCTILDPAWRWT